MQPAEERKSLLFQLLELHAPLLDELADEAFDFRGPVCKSRAPRGSLRQHPLGPCRERPAAHSLAQGALAARLRAATT